jgi:hypothetical protein
MMKKIIFAIVFASLLLGGCAELNVLLSESQGTSGGLTTAEVIRGLKEALVIGAEHSVTSASAEDGFFGNPLIYIPFPPEAVTVKNTLEKAGFISIVKDFEKSLNRAGEDAVKKAFPIFKDAITKMTITDAMNILRGPEDAATMYLQSNTEDDLRQAFLPVARASIEKVDVTGYWRPVANVYNQIAALTGGQQVNPDLTEYVTQKSLDGLFILIAKEEKEIRKNPAARITDLLKRVFGAQ